MPLASTKMFEFKVGASTGPVSLPSFNIGQFNSEEQILLFIQKKMKI